MKTIKKVKSVKKTQSPKGNMQQKVMKMVAKKIMIKKMMNK
jgi:hypothetical protein